MKRAFLSVMAVALLAAPAPAAKHTVELTIAAGKHDRANEPVCVPLQLPEKLKRITDVALLDGKGTRVAEAELIAPGLATRSIKPTKGHRRQDLHFVLPKLGAGQSVTLKLEVHHGDGLPVPASAGSYRFRPVAEEAATEVTYHLARQAPRKVLAYIHPKLDDTSAAAREATFKPFHRVYSPDGTVQVTKDVGGRFTHHRGLFYGFMRTTYDNTTVDIWHCRGETHQAHTVVENTGGDALARHLCHIDWNGKDKKTFAKELRELTVYNVPGGTLIEFVSQLTPTGGDVKLDGDPQHAGFHFRASDEVASKTSKQTIFIRPDGVGKPGTEVNWPKEKKHVNLPWLAMSFVVGDKRYTAAYLDHPSNPKEARYSERTYGRFGSYFVTTVSKDKPLLVRYRVWLQDGQMTQEQVKAKSAAFVAPVEVKVK